MIVPLSPELLIAAKPDVVALPSDPVVAARQSDIAGDFLDVANDRQASSCSPRQFSLGPRCLLVNWRPKCQQTPSVLYLARGPQHGDDRRASSSLGFAYDREPVALVERYVPGIGGIEIRGQMIFIDDLRL
jgi:hypothetical protein